VTSEETPEQFDPLSMYGVLVVPPTGEHGGWLISVSGWNAGTEAYISAGSGPIFETRDEAMAEAARVLSWLQDSADDFDAADMWDRLQRVRAATERGDDPSRPWGRF
jgi:hypothetical protein